MCRVVPVLRRRAPASGAPTAVLRLPMFADAAPARVERVGMQMELTPDGLGGYDGFVQGAVRQPFAVKAAFDARNGREPGPPGLPSPFKT